jgi:acetyl esterase/lipase
VARWHDLSLDVVGAPGVADGTEAIRQIRSHAAEFGTDPAKIVFLGFSAGAHMAAWQALSPSVADRPDYAAPVYVGPTGDLPEIPVANLLVPAGTPIPEATGPFVRPFLGPANPNALPPIFKAGAQDDFVAGKWTPGFYETLIKAGYKPDANFFTNGAHGYGPNQTTSSRGHWGRGLLLVA